MGVTAGSRRSTPALPEELRGVHHINQRGLTNLQPRLFIVLVAAQLLFSAVAEMWLLTVLWALLLPFSVVSEVFRRRERDELHADGVSVHGGLRLKHIAWAQVLSVRPPSRWRGGAWLKLEGNREVALRCVDDETTRALARWIDGMTPAPK